MSGTCSFVLSNSEGKKEFEIGASIVPIIGLTMIILGVIINVICSLFFRDLVGAANPLFFWGFLILAISVFIYALKDKM
jgi:vacuolar-type H+-ATPase subunit I/STV1